MAKKMSLKSVSYSRISGDFEAESKRFKNEVSFLPIKSKNPKTVTQMTYLAGWSDALQSVFRAELVKTLTKQQIQEHLNNIIFALEEVEPNKIFKVSCHPQSDNTTKSAHFHIWGDVSPKMEEEFENYLKLNRLTVANQVNITAISKGQLREVSLNEDGIEEIRAVSYNKQTGHYNVTEKSENNTTKSTVLSAEKIPQNGKDEIEEYLENKINSVDKMIREADRTVEYYDEMEKIKNFEKKFEQTRKSLNENLDSFLSKTKHKREDLTERIKKLSELEQ